MKLVGDLAKKAEAAETKEELKEAIQGAGIELDDAELDSISGGYVPFGQPAERKSKNEGGGLVAGHL